MQQTIKAKVVNCLVTREVEMYASDKSSDLNESEHADELFDSFFQNKL